MKSHDHGRGGDGSVYATLVHRPVGVLVAFVTLLVIGVIAYTSIPIQMLPGGLSGTRLSIWVTHPGSSAAENEDKVARIIEEQFRTLPGLDSVYSRSSEGSVYFGVRFNGQADMDLAKAELRDRIERARPQLPETVDRINVWANDDGDLPVMWFAILTDGRSSDMDYLIEYQVQRRLEAADGVSRVNIFGLLDDSVRILLDEEKVRAANLDLGALIQRLQGDNFAAPLGEVTDGGRRFLLRSDMRFEDFDEIEAYPIGGGLRLGDVARVEKVKTVRNRLARINGRDAYYGMIQKESTANVVQVSENIKQVVAAFEDNPLLAGRVRLEPLFDQAVFIQTSLDKLRSTALWGGLLAVAVLFLFLRRIRMTLCVAMSIPTAALLSIAYEHFSGGSFNVLTMTGLTLALGMLVDNAVVVIENIVRVRGRGLDARAAAVEGVRDVGLAVALATMTSVVVFLPLIFMGENPSMRVMLTALGIPLCTSLLFSLFVALVFLPVITARILGERPRPVEFAGSVLGPLFALPVRGLAHLIGLLRRGLHGLTLGLFHAERGALALLSPLRWPLAIALLALAGWQLAVTGADLRATGGQLGGIGADLRGIRSGSAQLTSTLVLSVLGAVLLLVGVPRWRRGWLTRPAPPATFVPEGSSLLAWIQNGNRRLLAWTLEHRLLALALAFATILSAAIPAGKMTMTAFGQEEDTAQVEIDVDMEANFTLSEASREFERYEEFLEERREELGFEYLVVRFGADGGELSLRWTERMAPDEQQRVRELLRRELPRYPGHELRFAGEQQVDSTMRQFANFQIRGTSAEALERYGKQAIELLRGVPGLLDVSSPLEAAPEQVRLAFDGETAFKYGVTSDIALRNIAWVLRGAQLPRYQEEGREIPLIMEYDEEQLAGLSTLRDLEIFTGEGQVPLAAFTDIQFQPGQRQIFRWNGQTTFNIQARLADPNRQGELVEAGYTALEALELPRGFSLGRDDSLLSQQAAELAELQRALLLSVVLVFLLMGILFESLLLPFSVLTTIPFAIVGALWTLYVSGTVMDSIGWIGAIILVGVVVNNGIVLIDKIHRLRIEDGVERKQAVIEGAAARVRPILMTAMTTVFGLLPMATGDAPREGIDYRALATCVAGGLAVSTFFTLWMVPLAYTLMDDLTDNLRWLFRRTRHLGPLPESTPDPAAPGSLQPSRSALSPREDV